MIWIIKILTFLAIGGLRANCFSVKITLLSYESSSLTMTFADAVRSRPRCVLGFGAAALASRLYVRWCLQHSRPTLDFGEHTSALATRVHQGGA